MLAEDLPALLKKLENPEAFIDEIVGAIESLLRVPISYSDQLSKVLDNLFDYRNLRDDFLKLDTASLWNKVAREVRAEPQELINLYTKWTNKYPKFAESFCNIAEIRTLIKKDGKVIDKIEEVSFSGSEFRWMDLEIGDTSTIDELIDIRDSYDDYLDFAEGALEEGVRDRMFDSELKYIYHFIQTHAQRGDEFVIEIDNLIHTCGSCQRELVMLHELMAKQGKSVQYVVKSSDKILSYNKALESIYGN